MFYKCILHVQNILFVDKEEFVCKDDNLHNAWDHFGFLRHRVNKAFRTTVIVLAVRLFNSNVTHWMYIMLAIVIHNKDAITRILYEM